MFIYRGEEDQEVNLCVCMCVPESMEYFYNADNVSSALTDWFNFYLNFYIITWCDSVSALTKKTKKNKGGVQIQIRQGTQQLSWSIVTWRKKKNHILTESVSGDRRQRQSVVSHCLILDYLKMNEEDQTVSRRFVTEKSGHCTNNKPHTAMFYLLYRRQIPYVFWNPLWKFKERMNVVH